MSTMYRLAAAPTMMVDGIDRFAVRSSMEPERRYTAIVHGFVVPATAADIGSIARECTELIGDYLRAVPAVEIIPTRRAGEVFVAIEVTTSERAWRARRALDAACDHIVAHAPRFGLAHAERTTPLTDAAEHD